MDGARLCRSLLVVVFVRRYSPLISLSCFAHTGPSREHAAPSRNGEVMVLIAALPRLDLASTRPERASLRVRCNSASPGSQSTLCLDIVRFGPTRGQALVRPDAPGLTDISAGSASNSHSDGDPDGQ